MSSSCLFSGLQAEESTRCMAEKTLDTGEYILSAILVVMGTVGAVALAVVVLVLLHELAQKLDL